MGNRARLNMRLRGAISVLVCLVVVAAAGCDSGVVTVSSDQYPDSVELSEDQTLEFRLSNLRPPDNTNWEWFVAEPGVVELMSVDLQTMAENDVVSGDWTLMFAPVQVGTADLVLVYRVPGQPDVEPTLEGAMSEYRLTVTVTEAPNS